MAIETFTEVTSPLGSVVERRVGSSPTARTKATAGFLAAAFYFTGSPGTPLRSHNSLCRGGAAIGSGFCVPGGKGLPG